MSAAARPSRERPGYFSKFLFCKASSRTCVKISQTRTQDQSGALESTLQHKLKKEGLKMPNPSHRTVTRRSQRLSDELPSDPQLYHARRDLLEACRAPCAPTSLGGLGHARAIALDCVQPFQELLGLRDQTRATEGRSFMPVYEQNSNGELPAEIKSMLCNWPVSGSGSRLVHRHILTLADRLSHYVGTDEVFALIRDSMPRRPKTWRMVLMAALSAQGTGCQT